MLTEKEYSIVKALVEEEMSYLSVSNEDDSDIMTRYFITLENIVEKLKPYVREIRPFSENISLSAK